MSSFNLKKIPELIVLFIQHKILMQSNPWNMNDIWSIENKNQTHGKEEQHRQVTKPINITLLSCAFESVTNIYNEIACVSSENEFFKV